MRPRTQKQPQVKKESCRMLDDVDVDMYLFCAMAVQPARTWAALSGTLLNSLHITSPVL